MTIKLRMKKKREVKDLKFSDFKLDGNKVTLK